MPSSPTGLLHANRPDPGRSHPPTPISWWRPRPSRELPFAATLSIACLAASALARLHSAGRPLDSDSLAASLFGLSALLLAGLLALRAWSARSMRYGLGFTQSSKPAPTPYPPRPALSMRWLWMEEVVPLAAVKAVYRGTKLGDKIRTHGLGPVGAAQTSEIGPVRLYGSIENPDAALVIATSSHGYALTPDDLDGFRHHLIQLLDATPQEELSIQPSPATRVRWLPQVSPLELGHALKWTAPAAAVTAAIWLALQLPAEVPAAVSPPAGSGVATVNDWTSVGQSFPCRFDNLNQISVVLAAERPTDQAAITLNIKTGPFDPPIRTVRRTVSLLPVGDPMKFRPGSLDERWETFEFEPIPDSGGRRLYFSVEGKDVPRENTVRVLIFYHSGYPQGQAYLNEKETDAHVPFRAAAKGRAADYVNVLAENLTRGRPGLLANPLTYLVLGALYLVLVALLLRTATRAARSR